ncbi:MAG: type VI secretion system protein TssA [Candidatus Solibacter sp.]|nr:type VI secretion system protein TssA [Candidatus Solibacter sp.]
MISRDEILKPIPGGNPSGESLRYAAVYTQIKEAAREDDDATQGVWAYERKVADWPKVIKLCTDALIKQSKDLQLAAWLTEAQVNREGFSGFLECISLIKALMEEFWETVHPELEDGDSEMRAVPLLYVASKLEIPLRRTPITATGLNWYQYKESTAIPTEEDAGSDESKAKIRSLAVQEGKTTPEDVLDALRQTQAAFLEERKGTLAQCGEAIEALDDYCNDRFGDYAPGFRTIKDCLAEIANAVRILKQRKEESGGAPAAPKRRPAPSGDAFGSTPDAFTSPASDPFGSAGGSDPFGSDSSAAIDEPTSSPFDEEESSGGSDAFGSGASEEESEEPAPRRTYREEPSRGWSPGSYGVDPESAEDCANRIAAAAKWLRSQDPANPAPYLMLRGFRWGELRASGPAPNWSLLAAAPLETRQTLKRLSLEPDWEKLLEASEEAMASAAGRGWLDIQRYTLMAMDGLGETYAKASEAVREDLRTLLAEYPGLVHSALDDDTPAASPQTREYFAQEGITSGEGRKAAVPAAEPPPEEMIREAVKKGRHEVALALVARQMKLETSGRGRFQWQVEQAQILMQAGRAAVAFPILKEVTEEIYKRRLEDWEPAPVVVHPLVLYYRCLQELGVDGDERQRIYATVCRLDPVRAFELG